MEEGKRTKEKKKDEKGEQKKIKKNAELESGKSKGEGGWVMRTEEK